MATMTENKPKLSDLLQKMIETGDMVGPLRMAEGDTSASTTVATSLPGQSQKDSKDWAFQVPSGYVYFSGNYETNHNGGDVAQCGKANDNPSDGTVHAYVKASQTNGYARAAASNLYAIRPEAAERLYKLGLNARS